MSSDEAKEPEVIASTLEETTLAVREPTPGELIRQAVTAGATPEVLQTLADLYERFKAGAAREAFVTALSEFQSKCPIIEKTKKVYGKNGKLRYCYAPLDVIVRQVRHILHECGLSYTIDDEFKDGMMYATCKVTHVLGHSETSTFMAPIDKDAYMNEPQKYASANTYAKRYAFCNGTGILTGDEDDDARSVGATAEEDPAPLTTAPDVVQSGQFTHDQHGPPEPAEPPVDDTYKGVMVEYKKLGERYLTEICDGDAGRRKTDYDKFREQANVPLDKTKLSLVELRAVNALVRKVFAEPPVDDEADTVPCEGGCGERMDADCYQAKYTKEKYGAVLCFNCAKKRTVTSDA